jgi:hypothetical protein
MRLGAQRQEVHRTMRGLGLHGRHQPRQELGIQIVAGRNAESTSRGARVKLPRIAEQPLGCTQNVCRGLHHAQPHIGRLHLCPGTHQQRVASELAQTPQAADTAGWCMPSRSAALETLRSVSTVCSTLIRCKSILSNKVWSRIGHGHPGAVARPASSILYTKQPQSVTQSAPLSSQGIAL